MAAGARGQLRGRRVMGLFIAAVAVAVGVLPGLGARGIAGSAQRAPVPRPPEVGACLGRAVDQADRVPLRLAGGASMTMPAAVLTPCSAVRFGEIAAVYAPEPGSETVHDHIGAIDRCHAEDLAFLGLPVVPPQPTSNGPDIQWEPVIGFADNAVGPDAGQRAAGASWVACVVGPEQDQSYTRTARGSIGHGGLPWDTSTCTDELTQVVARSPCAVGHRSQMLATSVVNPAAQVSDAELLHTCDELAELLMGSAGPLDQGILQTFLNKDPTTRAYVSCSLTPRTDRSLVQSIIGLGAAPVPLSR